MIKFKLNKSSALSILNPSCIIKLQTGWKQNNAIRNKQKNIQKKKKKETRIPPTNSLSFLPVHLCTPSSRRSISYTSYVSIATSISITISICSRWLSSWRNASIRYGSKIDERKEKERERKKGRRRKRQNWNVDPDNKSRNLCGGNTGEASIDLY